MGIPKPHDQNFVKIVNKNVIKMLCGGFHSRSERSRPWMPVILSEIFSGGTIARFWPQGGTIARFSGTKHPKTAPKASCWNFSRFFEKLFLKNSIKSQKFDIWG